MRHHVVGTLHAEIDREIAAARQRKPVLVLRKVVCLWTPPKPKLGRHAEGITMDRMAEKPQKRLSGDHRRALAMLADAGPRGITEAALTAQGFTADLLAELEQDGRSRAVPASQSR